MTGRLTGHQKTNCGTTPVDRLMRNPWTDLHPLTRANHNLISLNFEIQFALQHIEKLPRTHMMMTSFARTRRHALFNN
jgi:hypothetical protein